MSGPIHLPLIAWAPQDLERAKADHLRWLEAIDRELRERDGVAEPRFGFPVAIQDTHGISTAYEHFLTRAAAIKTLQNRASNPAEKEAATYRVMPIYRKERVEQ